MRLLAMRAGDGRALLSGVLRLRGHAVRQERSTGNCLEMLVRLGELYK